MKKIILILAIAIAGLCGYNYVQANPVVYTVAVMSLKDGELVQLNVLKLKNGKYVLADAPVAQYYNNERLGFIYVGATGESLQVEKNPYYGRVNDTRAIYKYKAGRYYIVNK